jgi:hypothetical protein
VSEDLGGKTLGKYELRERIGRGGMAEVYKAYHASLDRFVALKVLHPFLGEDPQFKERFSKEARNVAQLRHPNIVQVYDFDFDATRELYYMVMEHIDGPTLRARLMQVAFQGEKFGIPEAIRITRDLAGALSYAHARGMVHRDLKPGNIMFDSDGRVVLTDFGIARIISGPSVTASGSMIGTPAYMSPEQGLGQSGDHRSDIYSLGIVLYQLITGTTPFNADTPIAIVLKHVNEPLPAPSGMNPDIPEGLERIVYKALAKAPEERYQNVDEMAAHLGDLESASTMVIPPSTQRGGYAAVTGGTAAQIPEILFDEENEGKRRRGCLGWVLLAVALIAMVGGFYVAYTGLINQYLPFLPSTEINVSFEPTAVLVNDRPTATAEPTEPDSTDQPTPNIEATNLQQTVEALASLVITPSAASVLPDLTATAIACDFDYEVVTQSPPDNDGYPELTSLTKRIRIVNDSKCPLDDDTRFVFVEGFQLDGPDFVEFNRELDPGDEFEVVLDLRTPAFDPANPVIESTWAVELPGGQRIGQPLTFSLRLFDGG